MFIKGKELERIFQTEAAFYALNTNGREQLCRSLVTIRRSGRHFSAVDALFVLQNPGQCRPVNNDEPLMVTGEFPDEVPLVEAKPDYTIHQLMRLMERKNWDFVQVINLTDVCSGDFADFKERQEFMRTNGDLRHSIFAPERKSELESYVNAAATIIAGWGTKNYIADTALEAYAVLTAIRPVSGLPHSKHPMFYHPYPRIQPKCIQWLDDMEKQLEAIAVVE